MNALSCWLKSTLPFSSKASVLPLRNQSWSNHRRSWSNEGQGREQGAAGEKKWSNDPTLGLMQGLVNMHATEGRGHTTHTTGYSPSSAESTWRRVQDHKCSGERQPNLSNRSLKPSNLSPTNWQRLPKRQSNQWLPTSSNASQGHHPSFMAANGRRRERARYSTTSTTISCCSTTQSQLSAGSSSSKPLPASL